MASRIAAAVAGFGHVTVGGRDRLAVLDPLGDTARQVVDVIAGVGKRFRGHAGTVADPAVEHHGLALVELILPVKHFLEANPLGIGKAGGFMLVRGADVNQAGAACDQFGHLG